MKYFLCALNTVYLGLPSENTERIVSMSRMQSSVCATEGNDVYISLPLLFKCADLAAPHGIVLKGKNEERKTTLLTPPLDIDIEIPTEDIYSIPKAFSIILRYCRGACFINKAGEERLIFILDIDKIIEDCLCVAR